MTHDHFQVFKEKTDVYVVEWSLLAMRWAAEALSRPHAQCTKYEYFVQINEKETFSIFSQKLFMNHDTEHK